LVSSGGGGGGAGGASTIGPVIESKMFFARMNLLEKLRAGAALIDATGLGTPSDNSALDDTGNTRAPVTADAADIR
jgi:hypothetical protein